MVAFSHYLLKIQVLRDIPDKSHPSLKQASPSLTSSSAMLASGPLRLLSNSLTGRGPVFAGGIQGTKMVAQKGFW